MDSTKCIKTERLVLSPIQESDSYFILELVNSEGWLTFIGDRGVSNEKDSANYIQKIVSDKNIHYWVVHRKTEKLGIITLIKRENLPFYDIGFAFLPDIQGKGYAFEAANAVLQSIIETSSYNSIMATTIPNNHSSIRLIEKLGLSFYKTESKNGELSCLYCLDLNKVKIDRVIKKFYNAFTNKHSAPKLNMIYETCLDEAIIIKNTNGIAEVYDLQSFIKPREELLTNGKLQKFEEYEIDNKTTITRNIAQRFSQYNKEGILNGRPYNEKGNKMFQLVKIKTDWKICNVIWDDE